MTTRRDNNIYIGMEPFSRYSCRNLWIGSNISKGCEVQGQRFYKIKSNDLPYAFLLNDDNEDLEWLLHVIEFEQKAEVENPNYSVNIFYMGLVFKHIQPSDFFNDFQKAQKSKYEQGFKEGQKDKIKAFKKLLEL